VGQVLSSGEQNLDPRLRGDDGSSGAGLVSVFGKGFAHLAQRFVTGKQK
jgi:hypothetical protein